HLQNGDPIPLADAMYQLGRHYANVAALSGGKNKELFQRAERLYSASLEAYRARYGDDSEKARFAREGLVTVQQATGGKAPTTTARRRTPQPEESASRIDEAAVPRSAPATTETRTTVRRVEEPVAPPPVEERARVQPRRTDNAREEGEVAADVPPPPRRPRYVPAPSRENQQDASPDTGTAGGAPTAEGSPGTP